MLKPVLFYTLAFLFTPPQVVYAECRDINAIPAGEALAQSYFKSSEIFHRGFVQKVHNPSGRKEVAAYVKTGDRHYSVFSLVDENCEAKFIKRTRQND